MTTILVACIPVAEVHKVNGKCISPVPKVTSLGGGPYLYNWFS